VAKRGRHAQHAAGGESPGDVSDESPPAVPDESPAAVSGESPPAVPDGSPAAVSGESPDAVPDGSPAAVSDKSPAAVSDEPPDAVPEESPDDVSGETLDAASEETPGAVPDGSPGRRLTPTRQKVAIGVAALLVVVTAGVGAAALAGGDGGGTETADAPASTRRRTTTTTAPTTTSPPETTTTLPPETTTTAPPETTTTLPPAPEADGTLRLDEEGDAVLALQQRLVDLGYWMSEPDGHYGQLTRQAVMAFQKVEGLSRDGIAGPVTQERLASAGRPAPRGGDGLEIDLERQVLFVVQGGQVQWAINTSTGNGEAYVSASGADAIAATPTGRFSIQRQIDGVRDAPLGTLYRPKYFTGGIAVHGSGSIPATPASHGCARVTNSAMDMLWSSGVAEIGTPVWVY
jgi:peptidoglycan hydrolase-like protein with peptidoglycan-binding domain